MGRRTRVAGALGTSAVALLALLPGAAGAAQRLPRQGLTHTQVTPSSCLSRETDVLAYSGRPTFTATSSNLARGRIDVPRARMQFEVWAHDDSEWSAAERAEQGLTAITGGVVAPRAPGGATFSWRPEQRLPDTYELVWRARLRSDGRPASTWSEWHSFFVDTHMPRIHECRVGQSLSTWYQISLQENIDVHRLISNEIWLYDFYAVAWDIRDRVRRSGYVDAAVEDSHTRRAWIAFRGVAPAAAREAIARFAEKNPQSRVRILTGRNYGGKQLHARMDRIWDLLEDRGLADPAGGFVDMRDGVIEIDADRPAGSTMTDRQIADAALADVRSKVTGYRVVAAGNGVVAGPDVQPVRLLVSEPEPPEDDPFEVGG